MRPPPQHEPGPHRGAHYEALGRDPTALQRQSRNRERDQRGRQGPPRTPVRLASAADVDRTATFNEQSREVEAIERLAEQLRREGASEATITQEIAKQTAGREADR